MQVLGKVRSSIDRQLERQPKEVIFCKKCVVSNQRPRIQFDGNGVCSACQYAYQKEYVIDWKERERELRDLCDRYRRLDGRYDVVVPASGGKDSGTVAHKLKHQYGMHPLTVTWAPFIYTQIGWRNYQNFVKSGFTNIMGVANGHLHRKLARVAFEAVGDVFVPFIYGQTSYPFHIALQFDIKLVFFGENSEGEYGGDPGTLGLVGMPVEKWADQYYKGTTVEDLIEWGLETGLLSKSDYDESDLTFYKPPSAEVLRERDIQWHFFGYYHKWIPQECYYYAAEHNGFQANPDGRSEGTYSKYASLDDCLDGFHYYMGFIKFGIGRATSDAAHEVRDGHLTRSEAVQLVHRYDGEFPKKYLRESLAYLDMTEEKMWEIVDQSRPPHLWQKVNGARQLKYKVSNL